MRVPIVIMPVAFLALAASASAADAAAGRAFFREVCTQCHTAEPTDGGGEMGPTLFSLFGRPAAVGDAAFPYSKALKESKLVWNAETLERFLTNPMMTVPGTTMLMPVPEQQDRENIIAYFQSLPGSTK